MEDPRTREQTRDGHRPADALQQRTLPLGTKLGDGPDARERLLLAEAQARSQGDARAMRGAGFGAHIITEED